MALIRNRVFNIIDKTVSGSLFLSVQGKRDKNEIQSTIQALDL